MQFRFKPLPVAGDIVWCRFPYEIGTPGPKPRLALVLKVFHDEYAVLVVYGTTKKTDRVYPGEFLIGPEIDGWEISGLLMETKFNLGASVAIPFDSDWFSVAPLIFKNTPLPKLGSIPPLAIPLLQRAYKKLQSK
ncbi:type II toxin-antitoxin system PemK/MazF family toxin [Photorhabdus khanii]|uniref:Type II toxin-antitoxin system PemK/MazF family toxin n=1 Tax=Photorhabdus khanii subsp. guanajuatensis TaxID=2100166 RepID=A0A4R4J1Y0_9GAMM|nr:type II toxin-antitoxin system PemK/MazF family toxin [Photorhabdus khanii]TDB47420.1 hypothetical protein C5467_20815 [Photorhabdus khanii subsp. guanajuatensis]